MLGIYHEAQRGSPGGFCGVEEEHGEEYGKEGKVLYSDNGGEYTCNHFLQLHHNDGIERHFTIREIL